MDTAEDVNISSLQLQEGKFSSDIDKGNLRLARARFPVGEVEPFTVIRQVKFQKWFPLDTTYWPPKSYKIKTWATAAEALTEADTVPYWGRYYPWP